MMRGRGSHGRRRLAAIACGFAVFVGSCATLVVETQSASSAAPGDDVLVGAGDIGWCPTDRDEATATVLDSLPGTVVALGDIAYPDGSDGDFANCYDPSWGRHRARTRPVPGNHEYNTEDGRPYYDYFGDAAGTRFKGWYSFDQAGWHVIGLNSNVSMSAGSEQMAWLRADLAASTAVCTVAMMHHPRFSSGTYAPGVASVGEAWNTLYDAGVDVVLSGHEHFYERFAPMNRLGVTDANGMRLFTIGTGGTPLRPPPAGTPRWPASEVLRSDAHGVVAFTLQPASFTWEFQPVAGQTLDDSGAAACTDGSRVDPTTTTSSTTTSTTIPSSSTTLPPTATQASDTFTRTVASGWGSSDFGGAWQAAPANAFAVNGTRGSMTLAAGQFRNATLPPLLTTVDVSATIAADKSPTGSGQYVYVVLRRTPSGNDYALRLRRTGTSAATISLTRRMPSGSETVLTPERTLNGWTNGAALRVRGLVSGTAPTQLSARAWVATATEPTAWTVSATDATGAWQGAGSVGIGGYMSGSATNAPVTVFVDDFVATAPDGTPPPDTTTTSTTTTSTTTTSTPTTTAVPTTTSSTTTVAPTTTSSTTTTVPSSSVRANDTFTRTGTAGWGAADLGGTWQVTPVTMFAVNGTRGSLTLAAGQFRTAFLPLSLTAANVSATLYADKSPTGSGQYVYVTLRRTPTGNEYAVRLRRTGASTATISLTRRTLSGSETVLTPERALNGWTNGIALRVRGVASGAAPTALSARAWIAPAIEPTGWTVSTTDATSALQISGTTGIGAYMSGSATNAPVTLLVDDFTVALP